MNVRTFTRTTKWGRSLQVRKGEFVAIMGPSGSGKSTLMHIVGALDRPTKGDVLIGGKSMARTEDSQLVHLRAEKIGFVFQTFNLLGSLSALDNVEIVMRFAANKEPIRRLPRPGREPDLLRRGRGIRRGRGLALCGRPLRQRNARRHPDPRRYVADPLPRQPIGGRSDAPAGCGCLLCRHLPHHPDPRT